jgi:hypothetical protein
MIIDQRILNKHLNNDPASLSVQSLVDRLQYNDFFRLFPPDMRDAILAKATHKTYQSGDMIYQRGDAEAYMGVVISGRLRMTLNAPDGRVMLIGLAETGEVFGETVLLDGLPRTTDAVADTETVLMIIRHADFIPTLKSNPDAMFGIIKMLCHRLRVYLDIIDLIALQNLSKRLARLLLQLAGDYGTEENNQIVIRAKLSQASIGQKLATSRESINKQLKSFAESGLISMKGDEIILRDAEGLHKIAG